MTVRALLAILLLSLPCTTGCVLEVEDGDEPVAAWAQPLEAAELEEWAEQQEPDRVALPERATPDEDPEQPQWASASAQTEYADEGFTPWQQKADPFPDPWMGMPDDDSPSSDE